MTKTKSIFSYAGICELVLRKSKQAFRQSNKSPQYAELRKLLADFEKKVIDIFKEK